MKRNIKKSVFPNFIPCVYSEVIMMTLLESLVSDKSARCLYTSGFLTCAVNLSLVTRKSVFVVFRPGPTQTRLYN